MDITTKALMEKKLAKFMVGDDPSYRGLPHSVAVEKAGWYQEFNSYLTGWPTIAERLDSDLLNPLFELNLFVEEINESHKASESLPDILSMLGLDVEHLCQATIWYIYHRYYKEKQGSLIEVTDGLNRMLSNSDIAQDLPSKYFVAPFDNTFVHFGSGLIIDVAADLKLTILGVYVKYHEGIAHLCPEGDPAEGKLMSLEAANRLDFHENDPFKLIDMLFITELRNQHGNLVLKSYLTGEAICKLNSEDSIYLDLLKMHKSILNVETDIMKKCVEHLAKIFLYMSLSDARVVSDPAADLAKKAFEKLGPKKRAKAERKISNLYNRIIVGPEIWPPQDSGHKGSGEMSPHMRRGHFRNQAHGPNKELRKLLFIKPILVRADLADGKPVSPKDYMVK